MRLGKNSALGFIRNNKRKTPNSSKNIMVFQSMFLLMMFFAMFVCTSDVPAASYYVDSAASGANNGTSWDNAWQAFSAISWASVNPGDTVYISGGTSGRTYSGPLTITRSGTAGNPITIRTGPEVGVHDGLVTITGGTNSILINAQRYVTVTGEKNGAINIRCQNTIGTGVQVTYPVGIKILYVEINNAGTAPGNHGIQFRDMQTTAANSGNEIGYCRIHDSFSDQIQAICTQYNGTVHNVIAIHHNKIYNLSDDGIQGMCCMDIYNNTIGPMRVPWRDTTGHPDGIQAGGGYQRIHNNIFKDIWGGNGFLFVDPYYQDYTTRNIYIYNNLFYGTTRQTTLPGAYSRAIIVGGDTPNPPTVLDNVFVIGNTIYDIPSFAIDVSPGKIGSTGRMTNSYVLNNIALNTQYQASGSVALQFFGTPVLDDSGLIVNNNVIYQGLSGSSNISWNGTHYTYNNFVASGHGQRTGYNAMPSFVSYTQFGGDTNDMRLSSSDTVATDRGQNVANLDPRFAYDYLGISRPQGVAWDIGAYESMSVGGKMPMPPYILKIE